MAVDSYDVAAVDLPFTDDELTVQAMAAGADTWVSEDAVPLREFLGRGEQSEADLLPDWYMPAPMGTGRLLQGWRQPCRRRPAPMGTGRLLQGWRRRIVLLIVASFVLLNAYGLCSTYGYVGFD